MLDRLYGRFDDTYVLTPDGELNFSGMGETVMRLAKLCGSKKNEGVILQYWYGGNLPESGYFGVKGDFKSVISNLRMPLEKIQS